MWYFPALDGLRLLASFNIVVMHLHSSWCLGTAYEWPVIGLLIKGPAFNASLFFVLGGFIYFHQLAPKVNSFRLLPFLKSRVQKLYPLHLVALILMALVIVMRKEFYGNWEYFWHSVLSHLTLTWAFQPLTFHPLNEPSWALTAFFLAYATLGLVLGPLQKEGRKTVLWCVLGALVLPSIAYGLSYSSVAVVDRAYNLFHVFPLLRLYEFWFGMVLGRLFQLSAPQGINWGRSWRRDLAIVAGLVASWAILKLHYGTPEFWKWYGHHGLAMLLYGWLIWHFAWNQGYISRLFSFRAIRAVGRASFYPYLLHLPLISWTVLGAQALGFSGFFKLWWQPIVFLIVLYSVSALYVWRKKRV
jgi:peptidoglycan/LPS O-acetylase OafA/YrhL